MIPRNLLRLQCVKSHRPTFLRFNSSSSHLPTIYALSTNFARSAIGVIRISGSHSKYILQQLTKQKLPQPRVASLRRIYHPDHVNHPVSTSHSKHLLDESLAIYFPFPKTYTGEDLVELHVHGGIAVIQSVLKAIESLHGKENRLIRYAQAGEFSQRAFQNGRFDLTEIEGIRELIDAETETARIAAINSATGSNKLNFQKWREALVENVGLLTAIIDFAEDTEIEDINHIHETITKSLTNLESEINDYLTKGERSKILLNGIKVTLLGPPNVGKSSILNKLANDESYAIVSDIAGTTRDVLNVPLNIQGYKVVVGDTAGIRDLNHVDPIEAEGIKRAKKFAQNSDLVLIVVSVDSLDQIDDELKLNIKKLSQEKPVFLILNKSDLLESKDQLDSIIVQLTNELGIVKNSIIPISCLNNNGLDNLNEYLITKFKEISNLGESNQDAIILTSRVKDILINDVIAGIQEFRNFGNDIDDVVLATEELQRSIDGIGKITGETVGVEEVLGVVFSKFCVGK